MNFVQKIAFLSGQDSDSTPELNKGFPYLHNVRILSSNDNSEGAITTVNGNTLVPFTLPTGKNTCIGYCQDKLKQKGYAFIYNESDNHSILEYDEVANTIRFVLRNKPSFDRSATPLNFKKDYLITSCEVVNLDEGNDLLYWTDGYINPNDASDYNEPKETNIQRAILYMTSSGTDANGYLAPFQNSWVDRIFAPPPPPTYVWSGGVSVRDVYVLAQVIPDFDVLSTSFITLEFPVAPVNVIIPPAVVGQWNTGTSLWTCPANGYYSISMGLYVKYDHTSITPTIVTVVINKNGGLLIQRTLSFDGTYGQVLTLSVSSQQTFFNAGDTVDVEIRKSEAVGMKVIQYLGNYSNIAFFWNGLTLIDVSKVNALFKKNFQFQNSYKYRDKQESVLSKKSRYNLAETSLGNPTTGEDFVFQSNKITISVWSGNHDVEKILLYGHEIGMTDTDILADIALIVELDKEQLGIDDNVWYEYEFLNDGNYQPISLQKKNQLFDYVYYYEQCLARFQNRIADANGAEGVNAVKIDVRLPTTFDTKVETNTNPYYPKLSYWKSGGAYEVGLVYEFNGARLGNTNTTVGNSNVLQSSGIYGTRHFLPFITETAYDAPDDSMEYVPIIKSFIYNRPPKDAVRYSIMRSKNQLISNYIQFTSQDAYYTDSNGIVTTNPSEYANYQLDINNITGAYKTENGASLLVYEWTKGDRVRLIAARQSENDIYTFYPYNDNETVGFFNGILEVRMSQTVPTSLAVYKNILFEVYTPAKTIQNDNELVFEVSETGTIGTDVNGNKIHIPDDNGKSKIDQLFDTFNEVNEDAVPHIYNVVRNGASGLFSVGENVKLIGDTGGWSIYGVVSQAAGITLQVDTTGFTMHGTYVNFDTGTIVRCSEQEFTSGDSFRRLTNMSYETNVYGSRLIQYTETMNASNMFPSEAWDYGRPNRIDNDAKRSVNKARIRFSQQFIPETNINGLSTIYDLNLQDYSPQYGGIMFMFYQNERLQAYQELKVLPVLVKQQIVQSSSGTSAFVSTADSVLSPQQGTEYYLQDFGIGEHPESWAYYGNRKYFFDVKRCAVIRLSQDGLVPISMNAKMNVFFADICEKILKAGKKVNCYGVYDTRFGEYILSIEPFTYGEETFDGVTISFNEEENQFTSTWGYLPETMGQSGVDIISFKEGKLYTHNTNALQNYFYDVQGSSEVWVYLNASPENVKVFQAIQQRGLTPFSVEVSNEEGQFTHLLTSNFRNMEGNWYSAVFRDEHTPNIVASPPAPKYLPDAIFEGNVMRSRYFLAKFKYETSDYNKWFSLELKFMMSAPTVK